LPRPSSWRRNSGAWASARPEVRPDRGQRLVVEEDDALFVALAGDQALAGAAVLHVGPVEPRELLPP
jgi:hypothetical protein